MSKEEELEARINDLTAQLKEERNDDRYGRLWEERLQLKEQLRS